jgi:hypothetical protein
VRRDAEALRVARCAVALSGSHGPMAHARGARVRPPARGLRRDAAPVCDAAPAVRPCACADATSPRLPRCPLSRSLSETGEVVAWLTAPDASPADGDAADEAERIQARRCLRALPLWALVRS